MFWNILNLVSFAVNIAFIICDQCWVDIYYIRPLGSLAVWIMWLKLFYFLRLFRVTAPIVRKITQIFLDMSIFSFVFLLALLGFANTFYLLARDGYDTRLCTETYLDTATPDEIAQCTPFTGGNFLFAIIHSFRAGLGDFQTDGYGNVFGSPLVWIVFLANAILI